MVTRMKIDSAPECSNCVYWKPDCTEESIGKCHRYPEPVLVFSHRWCGEWTAKNILNETENSLDNLFDLLYSIK